MNIWPRRLELKKETKAGSNQPPARDPVQFKLDLMPNYLISYLENTGSRCTRYVSMPLPNESSILPKFLEKSDPEVACKTSFLNMTGAKISTKGIWGMRVDSNPCTNQRIATKQTSLSGAGLWFWTANGRDMLIGGFESTRQPAREVARSHSSCILSFDLIGQHQNKRFHVTENRFAARVRWHYFSVGEKWRLEIRLPFAG